MEATVRLATVDDAVAVCRMMHIAFAEYEGRLGLSSSALLETPEDVASKIAQGCGALASIEGEPVGSGRFLAREDHVYIGRLAVLPQHRRLGIATRMMEVLEDEARDRGFSEARLEVRMGLPENVSLYGRRGYALVAVTPHPRDPSHLVGDMRKVL